MSRRPPMEKKVPWNLPKDVDRTLMRITSPEARGFLERYGYLYPARINRASDPLLPSCGELLTNWMELNLEGLKESSPVRGTTVSTCPTVCGCGSLPTPRRRPSLLGPSVLPCLISNSDPQSSPSSSSTSFVQSPSPSSPRSAQSSAFAN